MEGGIRTTLGEDLGNGWYKYSSESMFNDIDGVVVGGGGNIMIQKLTETGGVGGVDKS